jgi:hypothetical protein
MSNEELRIQSFLRLGYFIDFQGPVPPVDPSHIEREPYLTMPQEDLVRVGVARLRESFESLAATGGNHVVPLSGGLDSRLILSALLEQVNVGHVRTYTYGIPGSYDFEIGCGVAQYMGTDHTAIPLDQQEYAPDDLLHTAQRTGCQGILFHHPPLRELDRRFGGARFWSGFGGDAVAGDFLYDPPSATLDQARRVHLARRHIVRSVRLWNRSADELLSHMSSPFTDPNLITLDEQVHFGEAMSKFTAPLVLFQGYRWVTPLINTPWMDFMLSVPNRYRRGKSLMIEIGRRAFPKLFNLPSKNRLGHTFDTPDLRVRGTFWINRARKLAHQFIPSVNWPNFQYRDFHEGIRKDHSLRQVVRDSIEDLRRRGICDWVDFDGIWRRHDRRIRNHGDALIVLASLELVLKAREMDARA